MYKAKIARPACDFIHVKEYLTTSIQALVETATGFIYLQTSIDLSRTSASKQLSSAQYQHSSKRKHSTSNSKSKSKSKVPTTKYHIPTTHHHPSHTKKQRNKSPTFPQANRVPIHPHPVQDRDRSTHPQRKHIPVAVTGSPAPSRRDRSSRPDNTVRPP